MQIRKLPLSKQIAYAFGMMGWSIMINLISVILVYLYLPPANSGLPGLITQVTIFGIFNVIALISASSRFIDAIYDPLIAQFSDRSKNPKGRRIPLMKLAILPTFICCCLVFYPLTNEESTINIIWLALMLVGFYISSTTYIIPFNALLPELAPTSEDKVRLSTLLAVGFVFGIGIASNAFNLADLIHHSYFPDSRIDSLQVAVLILALTGAIFLAIPVFAIDEKKYCIGKPSSIPLRQALRETLNNHNFRLFIIADFSYFIAITLILSGLLYFVTVLLGLSETLGNKLIITMVLVSFIFYPVVNYLAKRTGKKIIVILSLSFLAILFLGVFYLGKGSLDPEVQIFTLVIFAAIPFASLNILPIAILAEIIEKDSKETGTNKEAIYFAVRYFFVKIAQTFGVAIFAISLNYGKDPGNDLGIRLNGILGFILCFLAAIAFSRFKEKK